MLRQSHALLALALCCAACGYGDTQADEAVTVSGEFKKWHRVTLTIEGPDTGELATPNPFLDYRLDVAFTHGDQRFVVPGFYAADGNAAETGAASGNVWQVRFSPNRAGDWAYEVSFKAGKNAAVLHPSFSDQSAAPADGATGTFNVTETDKSLPDNRARGRLVRQPRENAYLKYAETGEYLVKVGVDAPENFLAYEDFDATPNAGGRRKGWQPHAGDFPPEAEAFTWQDGKGRNMLGAINYLASEGLNAFSFLTFNVDGDDRNVFPHLLKVSQDEYEAYANDKANKNAFETYFHKTRMDVSKLEQWERIFSYGDLKGMFLHFKTHENETDHLMDQGLFDVEGKLYYRELIARFGHHLALNWNVGEENNQPVHWAKQVAEYIASVDPYDHHRVIHTYPSEDDRYGELVGYHSHFTGASIQASDSDFSDVRERVLKWRRASDFTRMKWAIAVDEPGGARYALLPDDENPEHNEARARALWGALTAGAFGVEWYFGYESPNSDLTCQDFRSRDLFWDQNRHARTFFESYLPFEEMQADDALAGDDSSYVFYKPDELYVIYLHPGTETTTLNMGDSGTAFTVEWYDPRNGGELQEGTVKRLVADGPVQLGYAPEHRNLDWVALLRAGD